MRRTAGTYNVTGPHPARPLDMRGMLEACRKASGSEATFVRADLGFLEAHEAPP